MSKVTVIKQNILEEETWRYQAKVVNRADNYIQLEARYNRSDSIISGIHLRNNDRFLEVFFTNHWFNIFEIHDKDDDQLKGWYCDICKPAKITEQLIKYVDLKIDLVVHPDGTFDLKDEDEFANLGIDPQTRKKALDELEFLRENFFDILHSLTMGLK